MEHTLNSIHLLAFLLLLFIFFSLKIAKSLFESKFKKAREAKLPPGPQQLPIIGSLHHLVGKLPHRALRDLAKAHGPLMHFKLGEVPTVVVSSADVAREVTKTHDVCLASRPDLLVSRVLLYGTADMVFARYGDYWRQVRKLFVMELLSAKRVESFESIREAEVSKLIQTIRAMCSSPVNVCALLHSLSADVLARAAFGKQCKDKETFFAATKEALKFAAGFCLADLFPSMPLVRVLSCIDWRLEKCHANIDRVLNSIIEERKKWKGTESGDNHGEEAEENLLDVLLNLQENGVTLGFSLTDDSIKALIFDAFQAGSGTTGSTMSWTMSELIKNPRVMKKAQSEIRRVFAGKSMITEKDIGQLNYLKLVIKEALRLHPPAPLLIPRVCTQSCEIHGYEIPVNARVLINVWALGRDPNYWNDPEEFKPERFQGSQIDYKGGDYEYLPFGAGRRICPGISFAMSSAEHTLALLLYHFDWSMPHGMSHEEVDMTETTGLGARMKHDLILFATPYAGDPY